MKHHQPLQLGLNRSCQTFVSEPWSLRHVSLSTIHWLAVTAANQNVYYAVYTYISIGYEFTLYSGTQAIKTAETDLYSAAYIAIIINWPGQFCK